MRRSDFIVTPEHFLRYLWREVGLKRGQAKLPKEAVLVFASDDWKLLTRRTGGRKVAWNRWVSVGRAGRHQVVIARSSIGAPAAAIAVEELIVLGVRECLTFGACGALVPWLRIGDVVVPTFAYAEDGTSRLYGGQRRPRVDPVLADVVAEACKDRSISVQRGGTWTTDAPYRESRARVRWLAARGVLAVEMEAAAVYAVARERGIRAASLFVVSDELGGDGWNPGFYNPAFLRGKRKALAVLVEVIARRRP